MSMVKYEGCSRKNKVKPKPPIRIDCKSGQVELVMGVKLFNVWEDRIDLFFDEETFNIDVVNTKNGQLAAYGKDHTKRVSLIGFLYEFDLEVEDIIGRYDFEKISDNRIRILRLTRRSLVFKKLERFRFTVTLNDAEKALWENIKGQISWVSFTRSAVHYYIADNHPGLWGKYIERREE